jgi:hypothetical protein
MFGWRSDVVLAGSARRFVDDHLRPIHTIGARRKPAVIAGGEMIRECFVWGNRIGEPTAVMFRRQDAGRKFNDQYSQVVDLEMWSHLLRKGSFAYTPETLCEIRIHAGQTTRQNIHDGRIVTERRQLYREMLPLIGAPLSLLERWIWDARMALCVARYGGETARKADVAEVFFPSLFRALTLPLISFVSILSDRRA